MNDDSDLTLDMLGEVEELKDDDQNDKDTNDSSRDTIDLDNSNPIFLGHSGVRDKLLTETRCSSCKRKVQEGVTFNGLCPDCALREFRDMEHYLVRFKRLKEPRRYCVTHGHGPLVPTPGHKDWDGDIVINGVHLYPVEPLCPKCLALLTSGLVAYLEERGILRNGAGHEDNPFSPSSTYKQPLPVGDREEAIVRLRDYIESLQTHMLAKNEKFNELLNEIASTRSSILKSEARLKNKESVESKV